MGLYVEVMCDIKKGGIDPIHPTLHRCHSLRSDNPQGPSIAAARHAAREAKWKIGPGKKAICPGCLTTAIRAATKEGASG